MSFKCGLLHCTVYTQCEIISRHFLKLVVLLIEEIVIVTVMILVGIDFYDFISPFSP